VRDADPSSLSSAVVKKE